MRHLFLLIAVIGLPLVAGAQAAKPLPSADLAVYKGADREQALVSLSALCLDSSVKSLSENSRPKHFHACDVRSGAQRLDHIR
jgi:hypothetical protein